MRGHGRRAREFSGGPRRGLSRNSRLEFTSRGRKYFRTNCRSYVARRPRRQFLRVSAEGLDPVGQGGRRGARDVRPGHSGHYRAHDQDVPRQTCVRVGLEIRQARAQNGSLGLLRR